MEKTWREKIEGTTDQMLAQIRKLIDEGNIRRVVVKHQGKTVAEFPLTVGVVGTVIAPVAAAIGALTAVLAECSIEVEKTAPPAPRRRRRMSRPSPADGPQLTAYTSAPCSDRAEPATFAGFGPRRSGRRGHHRSPGFFRLPQEFDRHEP